MNTSMTNLTFAAALLAALGVASADVPADPQPRAQSDAPMLAMRMVEDVVAGNIFNADRTRREPPPARDPDPAPAPEPEPKPDPDASLVLVGVVIRDDATYAFIEDRQSGEVRRASVPGAFAQGELVEANVDGVVYRVDGSARTIRVHQTLAGEDAETLAAGRSRVDTGAGRTRASGSSGPSGGASDAQREAILERLRRAREQETPRNPSSE